MKLLIILCSCLLVSLAQETMEDNNPTPPTYMDMEEMETAAMEDLDASAQRRRPQLSNRFNLQGLGIQRPSGSSQLSLSGIGRPSGFPQSSFGGRPSGISQSSLGGRPSGISQSSFGGRPSGISQSSFGSRPFGHHHPHGHRPHGHGYPYYPPYYSYNPCRRFIYNHYLYQYCLRYLGYY